MQCRAPWSTPPHTLLHTCRRSTQLRWCSAADSSCTRSCSGTGETKIVLRPGTSAVLWGLRWSSIGPALGSEDARRYSRHMHWLYSLGLVWLSSPP